MDCYFLKYNANAYPCICIVEFKKKLIHSVIHESINMLKTDKNLYIINIGTGILQYK